MRYGGKRPVQTAFPAYESRFNAVSLYFFVFSKYQQIPYCTLPIHFLYRFLLVSIYEKAGLRLMLRPAFRQTERLRLKWCKRFISALL